MPNIVKKKVKKPYLKYLLFKNLGIGLFLDRLNLLPRKLNNCPLPQYILQYDFPPPNNDIIIGVKKHSNPSHANSILKNLGLNMSTFVNMAIKQLIYTDGLPFEVKNPKPSSELLEALKEGEDILNGKIDAKGYNNAYDMLKDLKK